MPSNSVHISHVPESWNSKWPHHIQPCCWMLSVHPLCSHIWHTCQQGYYQQTHLIHNLFVWSVYGCVCLLHVLVNWHICWVIEKKWTCWESCPCYCICQKVSIIFLRCPALAYLISLAFYDKMFIGTVSGAIAANFASTHGVLIRCWTSMSPISARVWYHDTLQLSYHKKTKLNPFG
jgi:hypothetical protein